MLRLVKRPGSDSWYVRGTFRGRSIWASAKTTDKATAQRFKSELEVRIARDDGVEREAITFKAAADLYLTYRNRSKVDRVALDRLNAVIGHTLLMDIRQHMIVNAANRLYPDAAASTKNRQCVGIAGAVLHYAAANNLCPYIRITKFKEKRPEPRWMHQADAERLIRAAEGKMKLALVFLFCQGWRISDMLRIDWEHIDLKSGSIRYHIRKIDEWRTTPLHARVLTMLVAETEREGRLFPWLDRMAFYKPLRKLCKAVGMKFTPHMARHSFATWLVTDGATLVDVMEAGGWRDHKSVLRYARINQERVRSVINRIKG